MDFIVKEVTTASEYSLVRDGGAGLIDLSSRGRLLVSGSEAVMFLNGLITNDMKTLSGNSWMAAAFLNVQGRLLAAVRVIHRHDEFLIDTEGVTHDKVLKLLERFILAGDFQVADLTNQTAMFSIQGNRAAAVVRALLGDDSAEIARLKVAEGKLTNGSKVIAIHATHSGEDGFDLFVDAGGAAGLRESLSEAGAQQISAETVETLRIEAGIPRYGIDMDETNVLTETNLDDALSFSKGCYLGQEIIVRIRDLGHVAKKLTGIRFDSEVELNTPAKVLSVDDKEIGRITSATFSPRLDRTVALGYVKYDYLAPGTNVKVVDVDRQHAAEVADLPFVRGGWYED